MFDSIKKFFKGIVNIINLIINTILLSLVYILAVGLTSLIAKLAKKKFLHTEEKLTYWNDLKLSTAMEDYYRQF